MDRNFQREDGRKQPRLEFQKENQKEKNPEKNRPLDFTVRIEDIGQVDWMEGRKGEKIDITPLYQREEKVGPRNEDEKVKNLTRQVEKYSTLWFHTLFDRNISKEEMANSIFLSKKAHASFQFKGLFKGKEEMEQNLRVLSEQKADREFEKHHKQTEMLKRYLLTLTLEQPQVRQENGLSSSEKSPLSMLLSGGGRINLKFKSNEDCSTYQSLLMTGELNKDGFDKLYNHIMWPGDGGRMKVGDKASEEINLMKRWSTHKNTSVGEETRTLSHMSYGVNLPFGGLGNSITKEGKDFRVGHDGYSIKDDGALDRSTQTGTMIFASTKHVGGATLLVGFENCAPFTNSLKGDRHIGSNKNNETAIGGQEKTKMGYGEFIVNLDSPEKLQRVKEISDRVMSLDENTQKYLFKKMLTASTSEQRSDIQREIGELLRK